MSPRRFATTSQSIGNRRPLPELRRQADQHLRARTWFGPLAGARRARVCPLADSTTANRSLPQANISNQQETAMIQRLLGTPSLFARLGCLVRRALFDSARAQSNLMP